MRLTVCVLLLVARSFGANLPQAEYEDKVRAAWYGQIIGALMGFQFEHKQSAVARVDKLPDQYQAAPVDDDYFYEMVAIRGFERYGINMTVEQLGQQWKENNAGAWGSSEQARLLLGRGIKAPDTGHPRYNKLWFSIGPQFSADVYGMLAPGHPNVAGKLARNYGHINGYAEGTDGAVFVAGMVSLAFVEKDTREIVRKAAKLIDPASPYRKAIDQVIAMAERGSQAKEIAEAVNDKWQVEYPATNNAVANGALVALSVWFGEGDYLQTANVAFQGGDFTDTDCNAANAGAVVGALRGMKGIPEGLVAQLHDRIRGNEMGGVPVVPPVDESITGIAARTVRLGLQFLAANGEGKNEPIRTQPAELFSLADLTRYWNADWQLIHAGFGGAGGGMKGLRGNTYLDGAVLATYPRDEVRGAYLTRKMKAGKLLQVDVRADKGRVWLLEIFADNDKLASKLIEGEGWQTVQAPLDRYTGREVVLRMYQRVLIPERVAGNAYWRNARVE